MMPSFVLPTDQTRKHIAALVVQMLLVGPKLLMARDVWHFCHVKEDHWALRSMQKSKEDIP